MYKNFTMETQGYKNWWFLAANGLIFILFGCLMLFFTQEVIKTILRWFGIIMVAGGAVMLVAGINNIRRDKAGAMVLVSAIVALAIGLALTFFPEASMALFLIMIGIWAIMIGIIQLVIMVNVKSALANKNLLLLNGLFTIALGVIMLFNPFQWAIILVKLIGAFAALFGILLIYLALMLRSARKGDD
jgi:uncharacterized membrane protein HdeD (DUF308 family)